MSAADKNVSMEKMCYQQASRPLIAGTKIVGQKEWPPRPPLKMDKWTTTGYATTTATAENVWTTMSVCACEEPVAHIELPISETGLPFESPANLLPAENTDGDVPIRDFKCYWILFALLVCVIIGKRTRCVGIHQLRVRNKFIVGPRRTPSLIGK